jgi:putative endonuclease
MRDCALIPEPSRQSLGAAAESRAACFLESQGLRIVARNFRVRGGEIDLIANDHDSLVFVEVRSRATNTYGSAAESIGHAKRSRIILAARLWLQKQRFSTEMPCRFDCVLVDGDRLSWVRNAFTAD